MPQQSPLCSTMISSKTAEVKFSYRTSIPHNPTQRIVLSPTRVSCEIRRPTILKQSHG